MLRNKQIQNWKDPLNLAVHSVLLLWIVTVFFGSDVRFCTNHILSDTFNPIPIKGDQLCLPNRFVSDIFGELLVFLVYTTLIYLLVNMFYLELVI